MSDDPAPPDEKVVDFERRELVSYVGKMLASIMHLNSAVLYLTRDDKMAALEQVRQSGLRIDEILNGMVARIKETE